MKDNVALLLALVVGLLLILIVAFFVFLYQWKVGQLNYSARMDHRLSTCSIRRSTGHRCMTLVRVDGEYSEIDDNMSFGPPVANRAWLAPQVFNIANDTGEWSSPPPPCLPSPSPRVPSSKRSSLQPPHPLPLPAQSASCRSLCSPMPSCRSVLSSATSFSDGNSLVLTRQQTLQVSEPGGDYANDY